MESQQSHHPPGIFRVSSSSGSRNSLPRTTGLNQDYPESSSLPSVALRPQGMYSMSPQIPETTITAPSPPARDTYQGSPNHTGTSSSAAPGPVPATTPLAVRQDSNGVQWIAFEYTRDRVQTEYTIRCDVESVDVDSLREEFKTENCLYPSARRSKDTSKGNRLAYQTDFNAVGWALAELNPALRGKRGLIQRAVDSWRNSNQDPRLRSRRVRRQVKLSRRQLVDPQSPHMASDAVDRPELDALIQEKQAPPTPESSHAGVGGKQADYELRPIPPWDFAVSLGRKVSVSSETQRFIGSTRGRATLPERTSGLEPDDRHDTLIPGNRSSPATSASPRFMDRRIPHSTESSPENNYLMMNEDQSSMDSQDDSIQESTETNVTLPLTESHDMAEASNMQSESLEHIFNPSAYYNKLDALELKTAEICGVDSEPPDLHGQRDLREDVIRVNRAMENLQAERFCGRAMSILIHGSARTMATDLSNVNGGAPKSRAAMLEEQHARDEAHKPTVEDVPDKDNIQYPPPSSVVKPDATPQASAPAATPSAPKPAPKKAPAFDVQSEELFPALGSGPKPKIPTASAWGAKGSSAAAVANGAPSGAQAGLDIPRIISLPGKYIEQLRLVPSQMLPRGQLKKPLRDILRDISKRSKANVDMRGGPGGSIIFEGKGSVDAVRQALKEVAQQVGSKQLVHVLIPTSARPHIIGRQGAVVQDIQQRTGARVQVPRADDPAAGEEGDDTDSIDVLIEGDAVAAEMARREIEAIVKERAANMSLRLKTIPPEFFPFVAGAHNANLRDIEERTKARPDTATIMHIYPQDFLCSTTSRSMLAEETVHKICKEAGLLEHLSEYGVEERHAFLARTLLIGLVSFSGSHVCEFDLNLWGRQVDEIPVGLGMSFRRQELACLQDFIGGPVWVLGKTNPNPIRAELGLKVALNVQDLQELWGPVQFVGGTHESAPIIRTERGFVVPIPADEQPDPTGREIVCHWARTYPQYAVEPGSIMLTNTSWILIGTCFGLQINTKCQNQINQIQAHVHHQLQLPGAHNHFYVTDGYQVQLVGGQYVTGGLLFNRKRIPASTHKDRIFEELSKPRLDIEPFLRLNIGLEISSCTGNAQRISLWKALCLSQKRPSHPNSKTCTHDIADPACIKECWKQSQPVQCIQNGNHLQASLATTACAPHHALPGSDNVKSQIIDAIFALRYTGIDHEKNLQAYWPFLDPPMTRRIPQPCDRSWFDLVTDTRDTSTFAVMSPQCLEFSHGANSFRCCPKGYQDPAQKTCLSLRVIPRGIPPKPNGFRGRRFRMPSVSQESHLTELCPGDAFSIGDTPLQVKDRCHGHSNTLIARTNARLRFQRTWLPQFCEHLNPSLKLEKVIDMVICMK